MTEEDPRLVVKDILDRATMIHRFVPRSPETVERLTREIEETGIDVPLQFIDAATQGIAVRFKREEE